MPKTRLGLEGYGVRRTGSFSGKTSSEGNPHPVGKITQFHLGGWGTRRYGSFAGRSSGTHPVSEISQFTIGWGSRRYGSFAGKTPFAGGSIPALVMDYRRRRV